MYLLGSELEIRKTDAAASAPGEGIKTRFWGHIQACNGVSFLYLRKVGSNRGVNPGGLDNHFLSFLHEVFD